MHNAILQLHGYNSPDIGLKIIVKDIRIIYIFNIKDHYIIDSTQIDDLQIYNEIQTQD